MKHKPHPESFRILAALAAAFGLAFLPSAAFAAPTVNGGNALEFSIDDGAQAVLLKADAADVGEGKKAIVEVGDQRIVRVQLYDSATDLANPDWSGIGDFSVGSSFLSLPEASRSSSAVTNAVPTVEEVDARFYRVVKP